MPIILQNKDQVPIWMTSLSLFLSFVNFFCFSVISLLTKNIEKHPDIGVIEELNEF